MDYSVDERVRAVIGGGAVVSVIAERASVSFAQAQYSLARLVASRRVAVTRINVSGIVFAGYRAC